MKEIQEDRVTARTRTGRCLGCAGFYQDRLIPLTPILSSRPPLCLFLLLFSSPLPAMPQPRMAGHHRMHWNNPSQGKTKSTHHLHHGDRWVRAAAAPPLPSSGGLSPPYSPSISVSGFASTGCSRGQPSLEKVRFYLPFPRGAGKQMQRPPCSYRIPSHGSAATRAATSSAQATQNLPPGYRQYH